MGHWSADLLIKTIAQAAQVAFASHRVSHLKTGLGVFAVPGHKALEEKSLIYIPALPGRERHC